MNKNYTPWALFQILIVAALIMTSTVQIPSAEVAGYASPTGVVVSPPTKFHSYQTLSAELIALNASQSDIASLQVIGTSWENRSIFALRIGAAGGPKKDVLFMGLHHANEWMSEEAVMYLLNYFVVNARVNPRVQAVLEKANLWFIPLVNPDGFEYSLHHDNLWRKNRRDNGDGTFGVDLNRNYGYQWGVGNYGTSTNSTEYRGPGPFSEPEVAAIRDFTLAHQPVLSLSYHTAGDWILFPWSYTSQPSRDDGLFRGYAFEMSASNSYKIQQEGNSNHIKAGNSDDWLYGTLGTLAFTLEIGPAYSSQSPTHIAPVLLSNVEPALTASELVLHLRPLSCTPRSFLCVPALSIITLGIPLLMGSVYFGARIRRRRHEQKPTMACKERYLK